MGSLGSYLVFKSALLQSSYVQPNLISIFIENAAKILQEFALLGRGICGVLGCSFTRGGWAVEWLAEGQIYSCRNIE